MIVTLKQPNYTHFMSKRKIVARLQFVLFCLLFVFSGFYSNAQVKKFQTIFTTDSLSGFDEQSAKMTAAKENYSGIEYVYYMSKSKREFINQKYALINSTPASSVFKPLNTSPNQIMATCTNMDFETGNLGGWTVTNGSNSNSSTMAGCCPNAGGITAVVAGAGTDPVCGASLVSPFGGNFICRINDVNTGAVVERIRQTFTVTPANSLLQFAYLAILQAAGHSCNQQPFLNIRLLNCANQVIACPQAQVVAPSNSCGSSTPGFVSGGGGSFYYNPTWQISALDLTPFVGSCVTLEITVGDCTAFGHYGYSYFDAQCLPMNITVNGVQFPVGTSATTVALCGSGTATITAPPGLGPYTWNGPAGSGVSNVANQTFTTNTAGQYTLTMNPLGACSPIIRLVNFSVTNPPLAGFSFTSTPCASSVTVVSTSSLNGGAPISNYQWVWGDATPNSTTSPATHSYTTPGPKQIKLIVTNSGGCPDSITQTVNVTLPPIIDFTVNPACLGFNTNFTNISTTGGAASNNYTWTFGGGGGTSNATNPSITFPTPGTYTVSLNGTNTDGCSNSIQKTFTVYPKPTISFAANPVCQGAVTSFTNSSSIAAPSTINNWFWDFNNDNIPDNTTQTPGNTFPAAGTFAVELKAVSNFGCADSAVVNVVVNPNPTVTFTPISACRNYNISLTNNSNVAAPSSMSSYTWNFGSATGASSLTSNAINPANLTYSTSGVKTITLTGITNNGCIATVIQTVNVHASPTASFNVTNICSGVAMSFTDASLPLAPNNGSVTGWAWDFDNNGSVDASTQNPLNTYPVSGTYTVTLIATSANGCKDTIKKAVNVFGRAVVDFTPTGVCFGAASNFTNLTSTSVNPNTGAQTSFTWSFGDGGSSNLQNPVYTYTNPLNATTNTTYNVTFFVTTSNGCKDSVIKPVMVYSRPTANFVSDSVCLGNATTLQDVSNSNGNPITLFTWDWYNDGIVDLVNNALSTTNTFTTWGNIPVSYTVFTSPNGGILNCSNVIVKNVWVHPGPLAGITSTDLCIDAQPMQISGLTSTIPVGNIINYAWSYGDGGNSSTNPSPATTHSYSAPGVYIVTLTVSSANGCTSSGTKTVEVWNRPYGSFVYSKTCLGKVTTLTAIPSTTGGAVASYAWDFNNSPQSVEATGAQVTNTFSAAGQQTLNLLLTSVNGCTNIAPGNVYINYNPKPDFIAPKRNGCSDLCINIKDSTAMLTGPSQNTSWQWTFGNGQALNSTTAGVNKVCYTNSSYTSPMRYDVKLIVLTDSGCVDSITKKNYVTVYPNPMADFYWEGQEGDVQTPIIKFTNTSEGMTKWEWYFNDGINVTDSVNVNPSHYFNTDVPASYNVFLAIRNSYGCKDTVIKPIDIGPNFTFYIPNTFTPNGDGINDFFTGTGVGIKAYKMWVFDRWGEMIYYTNDITKGWPGTVKGKTVEGKTDVYQWKVIVTDFKEKEHIYVGHVTELK